MGTGWLVSKGNMEKLFLPRKLNIWRSSSVVSYEADSWNETLSFEKNYIQEIKKQKCSYFSVLCTNDIFLISEELFDMVSSHNNCGSLFVQSKRGSHFTFTMCPKKVFRQKEIWHSDKTDSISTSLLFPLLFPSVDTVELARWPSIRSDTFCKLIFMWDL